MFIFNNFFTCFGHHYAHLQEDKTCVTARGVLRWFCWMLLVAVVGRWTVTFTVLTPYKTAPHNRYQPHPAEAAQHNTCSNIRLVLLKMGIMMPETCWEIVKNKHLTVASCWFSLSLHNLLTMHGHKHLKQILSFSPFSFRYKNQVLIYLFMCWSVDVMLRYLFGETQTNYEIFRSG